MSLSTLRSTPRPRVLSGMRPTGRLHLGNYMGALHNWVKLQNDYDCYFFIADLHALTTDYADPSLLKQNIFDVAVDFFAAGLNPGKSAVFIQSHVPQHAELHLLFSMFTPLGWLERVPTYKDQQAQLTEKELNTYGFLGYPLLQSADILLYRPEFVPVGADQVSHVELTREVARRFNQLYSPKRTTVSEAGHAVTEPDPTRLLLSEPQVLLTPSPKLPGLDGRKMSKSYGNAIYMTDDRLTVSTKLESMTNGGQRPTQKDPGDPEICPVGDLHRVFSRPEMDAHIRTGCRTAAIGCVDCKSLCAGSINDFLGPFRESRADLESKPDAVWAALEAGTRKATAAAEVVMNEVRSVMGLSRDLSGVRPAHRPEKVGADKHLFTAYKEWYGLEPALLTRNLNKAWRSEILPAETTLKADGETGWVTPNGRRLLVAGAAEEAAERAWRLQAKPKSFEFLVLLCWDRQLRLHDFIIPQKLVIGPWVTAKRAAGKSDVSFSVASEGKRYSLHLPDAPPVDITETESTYKEL